MIVGGGKQQKKDNKAGGKKKSGKGKGKKSSAIERAKAALKQAILNGTLNELLWKETINDAPEIDSDEESDDMPVLDDEDTEHDSVDENGEESTEPADNISNWNGLLNRTNNKSQARGSPITVGAEQGKKRKGKHGKDHGQSDSDPVRSDNESPGRSEDEESQASFVPVPRMRAYTRIMHKLKSAASRLSMLQSQEEDAESESSSEPEPEVVPELPPQRDEDEVLWAGVMGVPLEDKSTALSGYAFEASEGVIVDLFNMSNELRQERERRMKEEQNHVSSAEPWSQSQKLHYEDELKNKLEDHYDAGRRAMLRLHHNTAQFALPAARSHASEFSTFWGKLLLENQKHAPPGLYSRFPGGGTGSGMGTAGSAHVPVEESEGSEVDEGDEEEEDGEMEAGYSRPQTVQSSRSARSRSAGGSGESDAEESADAHDEEHISAGMDATEHDSVAKRASAKRPKPQPKPTPDRMHAVGIDCDNDIRHAYSLDNKRAPSSDSNSSGASDTDARKQSHRHAHLRTPSSSDSDGKVRKHARSDSDASDESHRKVDGSGTDSARNSPSELPQRGLPRKPKERRGKKEKHEAKEENVRDKKKHKTKPKKPRKVPDDPSESTPAEQSSPSKPAQDEEESSAAPDNQRHSANDQARPKNKKRRKHKKSPAKKEAETADGEIEAEDNAALRPASPIKEVKVERSRAREVGSEDPSSLQVPVSKGDSPRSSSKARKVHRTRRVVHAERSRELAELSTSESESEHVPADPRGSRRAHAPSQEVSAKFPTMAATTAAALEDDGDDYSQRSDTIQDQSYLGKDAAASLQFPIPQRNFSSPRRGPTAAEGIGKIPHPPRLRKLLHSHVASVDEAMNSPEGYEHLRGIWPYDPSLDAFRALVQRTRERKKARRCLSNPVGERISYFPKKPASNKIMEMGFDPRQMALVLSSIVDSSVESSVAVSLQSVYLTESVVAGMLTLRTRDTTAVPSGCLGSYSVSQWNSMVREINAALTQHALVEPETRAVVRSNLSQLSQLNVSATGGPDASIELPRGDNTEAGRAPIAFSDDIDSTKPPTAAHETSSYPRGKYDSHVFLTEPDIQDTLRPDTFGEPFLSPITPYQASPTQLQHLADIGYTAFQELSELYPLSAPSAPATASMEFPPYFLQVPLIQACDGPSHSVVIENDSTGGSPAPRRHRRKKQPPHTDLDVERVDKSSRFMDLIRDAVDTYKKECAMRSQSLMEKSAAAAAAWEASLAASSLDTKASVELPPVPTLTAHELKNIRYLDPLSLNQGNTSRESGYRASGFAAKGEPVQISIEGVDPYVPATIASPTRPQRPRRFPARTRSFVEANQSSLLRGSDQIVYLDIPAVSSNVQEAVVSPLSAEDSAASPGSKQKHVDLPAVPVEPKSRAQSAAPPSRHASSLSRRMNIDYKGNASPRTPADEDSLKIVMLVESRETIQVYFAKKFLRLEHVVDAQASITDASAALRENQDVYGLILLNFADLCGDRADGLQHSLQQLSARSVWHTLVVYNVKHCTDQDLEVMKACGVVAVLKEPHTVAALKEVLEKHKARTARVTTAPLIE